MKTETVVLHHLGLGDQIMMNGLVRHFVEKGHKVKVVVKLFNKESVEFMYRDCQDVEFIYTDTTSIHDVRKALSGVNGTILQLATYGMPDNMWEYLGSYLNWAHLPYLQAKVNPMYMYTKFKLHRDLERENKVYDEYVKGPYIFVHDQGSSNKEGIKGLRQDLQIIRPVDEVTNVFDYLKIIENAEEVHCINSSFAWLVELAGVAKGKRHFHTNVSYLYYSPETVQSVFTDWHFHQ